MTAQSGPPAESLSCHHCRRPLAHQVAGCRERRSGSCPFILTGQSRPPIAMLAAAGAALTIGVLLAASVWGDWLFVALTLAITLIVVLIILFVTMQYDSLSTSTQWTQYMLMGIPVGQKIRVPQKQTRKPLPPPVRLADPASHVAYYHALKYSTHAKATRLFRAALAGVLRSGCVEASRHEEFSRTLATAWRWRRRQVMTFKINDCFPSGALEQIILEAIRRLSSTPSSTAMTPYDIVRAAYGHDVEDPEKWVVEIVHREVSVSGPLVREPALFRTKYTFVAVGHMRYAPQINQLAALEDWMQALFQINEFQLGQQIQSAITSRKARSDEYDGW